VIHLITHLWNTLLVKLRLRQPSPQITRHQALAIKPLRNPNLEWEYNEEGYVVAMLTRRSGLSSKLISFFIAAPEERRVVLDEVGSFVWKMCDGQHSVEQISEALSDKYILTRREVEVSLNEYLRMLAKRGMILVAVPQEIVDQLDESTKRALGVTEIQEIIEQQAAADDSSTETGDDAGGPRNEV